MGEGRILTGAAQLVDDRPETQRRLVEAGIQAVEMVRQLVQRLTHDLHGLSHGRLITGIGRKAIGHTLGEPDHLVHQTRGCRQLQRQQHTLDLIQRLHGCVQIRRRYPTGIDQIAHRTQGRADLALDPFQAANHLLICHGAATRGEPVR